MSRLGIFFSFDWQMKKLLCEAYFYLGWARILKMLSFSKVAPSLGEQMEETEFTIKTVNKRTLSNISQALHMMSRYTFWESECLVKAIAAMKMLERRNIESTLYLGMAKDEKAALIAHAWLRSGPFYITGSEGMEKFTVVQKFAKHIKSNKQGGEYFEQEGSS